MSERSSGRSKERSPEPEIDGIDGREIERLFLARGWTQGKLALRSGVEQSLISMLVAGVRRNVMVTTAHKLARALGVHIEDLLLDRPANVSTFSPLASIIHEAASLPQEMQDYLAGVLRLLVNHELGNAEGRRKLIQIEEVIRKAAAREDPKLRKVRGTAEQWEQIANIVAGRGDAEEEAL